MGSHPASSAGPRPVQPARAGLSMRRGAAAAPDPDRSCRPCPQTAHRWPDLRWSAMRSPSATVAPSPPARLRTGCSPTLLRDQPPHSHPPAAPNAPLHPVRRPRRTFPRRESPDAWAPPPAHPGRNAHSPVACSAVWAPERASRRPASLPMASSRAAATWWLLRRSRAPENRRAAAADCRRPAPGSRPCRSVHGYRRLREKTVPRRPPHRPSRQKNPPLLQRQAWRNPPRPGRPMPRRWRETGRQSAVLGPYPGHCKPHATLRTCGVTGAISP